MEVPEEIMKDVRILYVSNLPCGIDETSEPALADLFGALCGKPLAVERVKRLKTYAFVHFGLRGDAEAALAAATSAQGLKIAGQSVRVSWSKPPPRPASSSSSSSAPGTRDGAASIPLSQAMAHHRAASSATAAGFGACGYMYGGGMDMGMGGGGYAGVGPYGSPRGVAPSYPPGV